MLFSSVSLLGKRIAASWKHATIFLYCCWCSRISTHLHNAVINSSWISSFSDGWMLHKQIKWANASSYFEETRHWRATLRYFVISKACFSAIICHLFLLKKSFLKTLARAIWDISSESTVSPHSGKRFWAYDLGDQRKKTTITIETESYFVFLLQKVDILSESFSCFSRCFRSLIPLRLFLTMWKGKVRYFCVQIIWITADQRLLATGKQF